MSDLKFSNIPTVTVDKLVDKLSSAYAVLSTRIYHYKLCRQ